MNDQCQPCSCRQCRYAAVCFVSGKVGVWIHLRSKLGRDLSVSAANGTFARLESPCGLLENMRRIAEREGLPPWAWGEALKYLT